MNNNENKTLPYESRKGPLWTKLLQCIPYYVISCPICYGNIRTTSKFCARQHIRNCH